MDLKQIKLDGKYNPEEILSLLDDFMTGTIGFIKGDDGFYIGPGSNEDFARAGYAMTTLRKKDWFMKYVKVWLHYNSDDAEIQNDFYVEDFKEYNLSQLGITA
jgi:hypothetical protein